MAIFGFPKRPIFLVKVGMQRVATASARGQSLEIKNRGKSFMFSIRISITKAELPEEIHRYCC